MPRPQASQYTYLLHEEMKRKDNKIKKRCILDSVLSSPKSTIKERKFLFDAHYKVNKCINTNDNIQTTTVFPPSGGILRFK